MRRTPKTKKLEVRSRKIDEVDPVAELRRLKEEELKRVSGSGISGGGCGGGGRCCF